MPTAGQPMNFRIALAALMLSALPHAAVADSPDSTRPAEIARESVNTLLTDLVYNGKDYFAVGWRGHILHSPDAQAWHQTEVPVSVLLTAVDFVDAQTGCCLLYTSPSPRDGLLSRMPSSA